MVELQPLHPKGPPPEGGLCATLIRPVGKHLAGRALSSHEHLPEVYEWDVEPIHALEQLAECAE